MSITDFGRLDSEFHAAVAAACGNPLLLETHRRVLEELYRSPALEALLAQPYEDEPLESILTEGIACHRRIGRAFLDRDAAEVEAAVHEHTDSVERRTAERYGRPASRHPGRLAAGRRLWHDPRIAAAVEGAVA